METLCSMRSLYLMKSSGSLEPLPSIRQAVKVALCFFLIAMSASVVVAQNTEPRWDDRFWSYGVDGEVHASAMDGDGNLYIAGAFKRAGGLAVYGLAKWDGVRWESLGQGFGPRVNGSIRDIVFDGTGNLIVGGDFYEVVQDDGSIVPARNLATWNGSSWSAMGTGVNGIVHALALGSDNTVYIGGEFSQDGAEEFELSKVAGWNGSNLDPVGNGLGTFSSVVVRDLAVADDGSIYAAGTELSGGLFKWDGQNWSSFGARHGGSVHALVVDSNDQIYIGGTFQSVTQPDNSQLTVNRVARWNGSSWDALGSGFGADVMALRIDGSGNLFAGGNFVASGDGATPFNQVARWDGTWTSLGAVSGGNPGAVVNTLVIDDQQRLYAGGDMLQLNSVLVNGLGIWDGQVWSGIGQHGLDNDVFALAFGNDGELYAGGTFAFAGSVEAMNIARLDDNGWQALGGGLDGAFVEDIVVDGAGNVYAAGEFEEAIQADGTVAEAISIARWDGTGWSALGNGFDGPVYALALASDGTLYAGGEFTNDSDGQTAFAYLASWDGTTWTQVGAGLDGPVNALAVTESGMLYAGGSFTSAGSVANTSYLARWDGSSWQPVSATTQLNDEVYALAISENEILSIGGAFTEVEDGFSANYIAQWDGSVWAPFGSQNSNGVTACCVESLIYNTNGDLVVSGSFEGVRRPAGPDIQASRIASWSTTSGWKPMSLGLDAPAYAMAARGNDLYIGGDFLTAGGQPSTHLARWSVDVSLVSIEDPHPWAVSSINLSNLYPNPARNRSAVSLQVKETQHLEVEVYDALGRRIDTLYAGTLSAGEPVIFEFGDPSWPAGLYFVRVSGERVAVSRSLVWVK